MANSHRRLVNVSIRFASKTGKWMGNRAFSIRGCPLKRMAQQLSAVAFHQPNRMHGNTRLVERSGAQGTGNGQP